MNASRCRVVAVVGPVVGTVCRWMTMDVGKHNAFTVNFYICIY